MHQRFKHDEEMSDILSSDSEILTCLIDEASFHAIPYNEHNQYRCSLDLMHVIVISFKSYDLSLKCGSHSWTCDDFTLQRIDDQMLPGEQINPTIYFALD